MNFSRTHSSAEMAFPKHCEYACALVAHRNSRWGVWWFLFLLVVCLGGFYAYA